MRLRTHPSGSPRREAIRAAATGLGLLLLASAAAADAPATRLDSLRVYAERLDAFGLTGQIVVAEGDSILLEHAAGLTEPGGEPVDSRTCFAVGSITKSLTGALVVRLARRGTLAIGDTLGRWLDRVPDDKRAITLRQLLTHTSGLPMDAEAVDEDDSRDEAVRKILAEPLGAAPGARFAYSNAGYMLLAAVVERAGGRGFADRVAEEILAPCGMEDSGTGPRAARGCARVAAGRNEWSMLGSLRGWRQRWAGTGAGDLVSTARDLARWARALQGAGPLSPDELDSLLAPRVPAGRGREYGFGVYRTPGARGRELIVIAGDVPGYHASAWIERRPPYLATVVVTSGERLGRGLQLFPVQQTLWRILDRRGAALPPETAPWSLAEAESLAGSWSLADTARLELIREGAAMRLGLSGPHALDLALGPDSTAERALLDERATRILMAAAEPGDDSLSAVLAPVERELWASTLRERMARVSRRLGELQGVTVTGTIGLPWLGGGRRTYVRLRFARGEQDASLAWLEGGLLDVAFGEGRPHPVLLPVAPLAGGGFAAWDLLEGRTLRLDRFADEAGAGLRVAGSADSAIARRARQ